MRLANNRAIGLFVITLLQGCASIYIVYYGLDETGQRVFPREPPSKAERLIATFCAKCASVPVKYEDAEITVSWGLDSYTGIDLTIKNKTNKPLTILWSEASIGYDSDNEALVCMAGAAQDSHGRRTYIGASSFGGSCGPIAREQIPVETKIEPDNTLWFLALPRSHVRWRDFSDPSDGGFWQPIKPPFGLWLNETMNARERDELAHKVIGRGLWVSLPIEIRGQKVAYLFTFVVNKAVVRKTIAP